VQISFKKIAKVMPRPRSKKILKKRIQYQYSQVIMAGLRGIPDDKMWQHKHS